MKKYIKIFVTGLLFISCTQENKNDLFTLQAIEEFLNFSIDEDTRLPKFNLWTFEENNKEYIAFPNMGKEILFYDIESKNLVKRVRYKKEGVNGVGSIINFYVTDFNHIYIYNHTY